jgi:hypothetical protein
MINALKSISLFCLICLSMALIFACSSSKPSIQRFQQKVGNTTLETLSSPTKVLTFKIVPKLPSPSPASYEPASKPTELTAREIEDLKKIILADSSYHFDITKRCLFIPDKAFKFIKDIEVTILISSTCQQMKFVAQGKEILIDIDPAQKSLIKFLDALSN